LSTLSQGYRESAFWEGLLSGFKSSQAGREIDSSRFETAVRQLNAQPKIGFLFEDLAGKDRELRDLLRPPSLLSRAARRFGLSKEPKGRYEHRYALGILKRLNLLDEYLAFIKPLGIKSSMSTARHYYHLWLIKSLAREHLGDRPLDVLEIGAGGGNLACFLFLAGLVRSYCIVDLPDTMLLSLYTITRYLPGVEIVFEDGLGAKSPGFVFVPAQFVNKLPDRAFDLCLNFYSFQEMDGPARDNYLKEIYRVGRPGALFINSNRRQPRLPQRDGTYLDNNPLLYPYRPDDRVLSWKESEFAEIARVAYQVKGELTFLRAAIIKPTTGA
jgi:SAM-dependent methyltransferase